MSDNDVLGHVRQLIDICQTPEWFDFWCDLECVVCTFSDLDLPADASDAAVWQACQMHEVILISGNRSANEPDSLQMTILHWNRPDALPVLTLADTRRILRDRQYAESVVERLLDILLDIDQFRGAGRLFLP